MYDVEEKWLKFKTGDLNNNNGLIVHQYEEVSIIMQNPLVMKSFTSMYLYNLLSFVTEHSDFYKDCYGFKSLQEFPIVDKEILRENWNKIFVPEYQGKKDNKEKYTSGSTGTPFHVTWDHRKHCRMIADIKYFAKIANCESHERMACLIVKMGEDTPKEKQERDNVFNIRYVNLGDESIKKILDELNDVNPKGLIGYGSTLDAIANYIYDGKVSKTYQWELVSIFSEGETLKERTRKIIADYFNCSVYDRYGNEENGTLAQEVSGNNGLGLLANQASYYFEILKMDSDEPVEDGEIGRLVITDLFNYAFPMIRYDCGDCVIARHMEDGRLYFTNVLGRKKDMLYTTDGKLVSPVALLTYIKRCEDIKQWQIVQDTYHDFRFILNTKNHDHEEKIIEDAKNVFGNDSSYTFEYVDEVPKLRSGKTRMQICNIHRED
jgi:phenylacetate-CoA ligase